MKKLLPFIAFILVACTDPQSTPDEPILPSYIGLPIVSYTITSTSNVQTSGIVPIGSFVQFRSTGSRKSQLTAGNTATLTISGLTGAKIRSITLHMRSNKSSGAGSLTVTNDGAPVWTINNASFNNHKWNGSYSTDTISVFHLFDPYLVVSGSLQIVITSSVNSLYIMRYDIEYEPAPERENKRDSTFVSGLKTITFLDLFRLSGPIENKYISIVDDTLPITNEDLYYITYLGDTAATLQHYQTKDFIGCANGSLCPLETHWSVALAQDSTFTFYTVEKGLYYTLETDPRSQFFIHLSCRDHLLPQHWVLRTYE